MRIIYNITALTLYSLLLVSCATFNKHVNSSLKPIETERNEPKAHRFYLIGDAGYLQKNKENKLLLQIKDSLANESDSTTVLFLGDNIYPNGMPKEKHKNRKDAEQSLQNQMDILRNFKGQTIFIPGNHDWYSNGVKGLKRQEKFIEKQLGKNTFLPENGCPIEKVNISDNIVLLIVDSQWYITNWDKHPTINDNCDIKTKIQFLDELLNQIKKARGKTTLIAIHHPIISNGPHGGQYSFRDHLKPAPILGTIKNTLRKTIGIVNADLTNKHYNDLTKKLKTFAKYNKGVIFVSGHEHSLQYIVEDDIPQIICGSASKKTPTRLPKHHQFAYGENGYAVLDVYKNGTATVKFITTHQIEYETIVFQATKSTSNQSYKPIALDSISASIYTKDEVHKDGFHKFLWGERFRKYYGEPVKAPVAYLDTLKGGLSPFRKGGGTQSKSLHLKDSTGKRFVLRAMEKQPSQYLQSTIFQDIYIQPQLNNTATERLVKDVFTGSYPYAQLITGTLSDAIQLAHLNPQLVYVPKQNALVNFNNEFGDELYIIEEHASDGHMHLGTKNFTGKIISTEDMLLEIMADESIMVEQKEYLKARLFDMLIGDWDRHQDQWRWIEYQENGQKTYKPLPRDRDQAFSRMSDGFMLGAAVRLIPQAKLLRKYEANIKSVESFNFNPHPLDITIFETLDSSLWEQEATFIQEHITDEVINSAFDNIPENLQDATIDEIKQILKLRRNNLTSIANRYFNYLAKYRIIKATNKDDHIQIDTKPNGEIKVHISRIIKGEIEKTFYQETFKPKETKELWIYGLDDTDTFRVTGKSKNIKINLIGGQNNDTYIVEHGKNIHIYDFKSKKNNVEQAQKATIKLKDDYDLNTYNYKKHNYSFKQLLPKLGYNPDEGFIVGANFSNITYGFERNPFTVKHNFGASYFTATSGFEISYEGEFANILNRVNFVLETAYNTPKFSINFFDLGNETSNNDDELGLDFNRALIEQFIFNPSLKWISYGGANISAGVKYNSIKVEQTPNRILDNNLPLPRDIFNTQHFGTINAIFSFENQDDESFPTLGVKTHLESGFTQNLEVKNRNFFYFIPEISINHKLNSTGCIVLATHLKSHLNFSEDFEFYQGASIGGNDGLRGFRNQRFTGQKSFYQSTDLRFAMGSLKNNIIPIQYGLFAGFDYGRVWIKNDTSSKWHNSQGGGLFLNIAGELTSHLGLFHSVEGLRLNFKLGFDF